MRKDFINWLQTEAAGLAPTDQTVDLDHDSPKYDYIFSPEMQKYLRKLHRQAKNALYQSHIRRGDKDWAKDVYAPNPAGKQAYHQNIKGDDEHIFGNPDDDFHWGGVDSPERDFERKQYGLKKGSGSNNPTTDLSGDLPGSNNPTTDLSSHLKGNTNVTTDLNKRVPKRY